MRMLFDATELTPDSAKSKGIYRYAVGLARALSKELRHGDQLHICCNGSNLQDFAALECDGRIHVHRLSGSMPGHLWRQWWMRWGAGRYVQAIGGDVYFSPKGFIPVNLTWPKRVARVCVLHDLIPFWYFRYYPGYFGRLERWLVGSAFQHAVRHADGIIAISRETRRALIQAGANPACIQVVHNGVDHQSVLPVVTDHDRRYIFAMASVLPHKNLAGLLEAYSCYRDMAGVNALPLKICGPQSIDQEGVEALGAVPEKTLRALYQGAALFVFLSLVEGFGYPPIEGLRAGTPVLCSDIDVFREVCGDLVNYVDPRRPDLAGAAMYQLLSTEESVEDRGVRREKVAALIGTELSWPHCAQGVWSTIRACAKG